MDREAFIKAIVMAISEMTGEVWHVPGATETAPSIARRAKTTMATTELVLGLRLTIEFNHPQQGRCFIYTVGASTRLVVVGHDAYRINMELTQQLEDKLMLTETVYLSHRMHRLKHKPALVYENAPNGVWYEADSLIYVVVCEAGDKYLWERIRVFGDIQHREGIPLSVSESTVTTAMLERYAQRIELLEQMRSLD